jgi:two-component system chemotaxis sensor kinase CheA
VARSPEELYELFLALAPPRLAAARRAIGLADLNEQRRELESALIPFAVDAALLGIQGVSALCRALASCPAASGAEFEAAIGLLANAVDELGNVDVSGARTDESQLLACAAALRRTAERVTPPRASPAAEATGKVPPEDFGSVRQPGAPTGEIRPGGKHHDEVRPAEIRPGGKHRDEIRPAEIHGGEVHPGDIGGVWQTDLAEDMVAAFLDECSERLDGLSERLLLLEQRGSDSALVDEVFRDLHTLKGSSAFAGLKSMNRVAHLAEDLMGELREGKRACDRLLVDVLLETLDTLRAILDRARAGKPIDLDLLPLLRRLRDPAAPPMPSSPTETGTAARLASPTETGTAARRSPVTDTAMPASKSSSTEAGMAARPVNAEPAPVQATLRIDFAKVDLLLNLVGEAVLARGRLTAVAETQATLGRELGQVRGKLGALARQPSERKGRGPETQLAGDLGRIERVLVESNGELVSGLGALTLAVGQLRDHVMKLRMVPISRLFTKYQRTVRELSQSLGKQIAVELRGAETELDKVLVERLEDPLLHLVRNAVDHGIEVPRERASRGKPPNGTLGLSAEQRGGQILVRIEDDGRGMDPAKLRAKAVERGIYTAAEAEESSDAAAFELIFRPGFSTAEAVSDLSGRGVGMDVVRDAITKLKGSIAIDSHLGQGTSVELRLPLTLAITQVLVARLGQELVAIPLDAVVSAQHSPESFDMVAGDPCLRVGEELVPVVDLGRILGLDPAVSLRDLGESSVVLVAVGSDKLGLLVDQVLGRHEVVIKSLGPLLGGTPCAAGATLLGDRVLLVVDLVGVADRARRPAPPRLVESRGLARPRVRARILVAEDSDVVRETVRRELGRAGFDVHTARDGLEALALARRESFDLVSTDVMMPGLDGFELTRALRQDRRYQKVPIVIVTSKDSRVDALRGFDAGADAYLTKPTELEHFIRTIEDLLARSGHASAPGDEEESPGTR